MLSINRTKYCSFYTDCIIFVEETYNCWLNYRSFSQLRRLCLRCQVRLPQQTLKPFVTKYIMRAYPWTIVKGIGFTTVYRGKVRLIIIRTFRKITQNIISSLVPYFLSLLFLSFVLEQKAFPDKCYFLIPDNIFRPCQ